MHALTLELSMIEVGLYVFIWFACHLISKCTLGFLGHHALKYAIGGLRIKDHPPLSHEHDKEGVCANICFEMHCHALSVLCCCQNRFLQESLAGRPSILPTAQRFVA